MVPIVAFVGYHNSGKTTFATKIVKELTKRGYKVAVLKSTKHENTIKDEEGKDTFKYKQAGAKAVGIVEPEQLILSKKSKKGNLKKLAFELLDDYDVVICEGFKHEDVPKFEVTRKSIQEPLLAKELKNVVGVISDYEVEGFRNFSINEPEKVADFIEEFFISKREDEFPDEVELFINDKRIPIKHYVKETLKEILFGFVKPLKGVEYPIENMEIRIVVGRGERKTS